MRLASAPSYVACVAAAVGSAGVQSHASNEFGKFVAHLKAIAAWKIESAEGMVAA
jgi:hypothetical protein